MRKRRTNRKIKTRNKIKLSGKFIWILVLLFIALQIFFTIQTSTLGATLADLERRETEIKFKNEELTNNIVKTSSLLSMKDSAEELGYNKPALTIYLSSQDGVAQLNR